MLAGTMRRRCAHTCQHQAGSRTPPGFPGVLVLPSVQGVSQEAHEADSAEYAAPHRQLFVGQLPSVHAVSREMNEADICGDDESYTS